MNKKVLAILVAGAICIGAAGCAQTDPKPTSSAAEGAVTTSALASTEPAPKTDPAEGSLNTIVATATGEVSVAPDVAYVEIGMRTENASATAAQNENDKQMKNILSAVKSVGISESEITTSNYSVVPEYDYSSSKRITKGYVAVNTARVTINDITKVGATLEAANKAGANEVGDIYFSIKERNAAYDNALDMAIKAARARAEVMAEAAGVKLGGLVRVQQGTYTAPVLRSNVVAQYDMEAKSEQSADAGSGVSSGELKVSAEASIEFEIK